MPLDTSDVKARQSLPLEAKVVLSQRRIREWYEHFDGEVYTSFSGGKDSTVLLDLVRTAPGVYDTPAVYCDTGLEYPEVRDFALSKADVVVKPKMTFKAVIEKYGYPVASKQQALYIRQIRETRSEKLRKLRLEGYPPNGRFRISKKWMYLIDAPFKVSEKCCDVMKKEPFRRYERQSGRMPMTGMMASEGRLRMQMYMQTGCNAFDRSHATSMPMGFWTEQDVLEYLQETGIDYAPVYGDIEIAESGELCMTGVKMTGCMFCAFGAEQEPRPNRFERMRGTHPAQYTYCMEKLGLADVLDYMGIPR